MAAMERTVVVRLELDMDEFLEEYREVHGLKTKSDAFRAIVEGEMGKQDTEEFGRKRLEIVLDAKTYAAVRELSERGGIPTGQLLAEALPLWEAALLQKGELHRETMRELADDTATVYAGPFEKKGKGGSAKR